MLYGKIKYKNPGYFCRFFAIHSTIMPVMSVITFQKSFGAEISEKNHRDLAVTHSELRGESNMQNILDLQ